MSHGPRIGALFAGRYRIEATLGEGGMGAVYRATDEQVGDVVALKTLGGGGGDEAVERFRREVRLARRITHPNVARIHDLGEHEGVLYLTMEYVRGRDLQHVLAEEGKLSATRAARLLLPVAEALDTIHRAGIVHRDLKPANVLVEEGGRVVLADFGIARAESDRAASFRTAGPIGTPVYMSPEQIAGAEVTAASDLYALGSMLYELLTGELPFLGPTPIATALARLHQDPPDPRRRVSVPDDAAALVLACLARNPSDRPPSASTVAESLRALASGNATPQPLSMQATMLSAPPPGRPDTVSPGDRALAVLPFRYRGPPDHDYLGDALTDELIDLLSTTRGLRVLSSGATERFRDERDPVSVGRALGVDALVDGTVQAATNRVRVTARLSDARTGTQLWSERFEASLEDVFELQERLGRRIAESLRVGLSTTTGRGEIPAEAVALYLRARKKMNPSGPSPSVLASIIEPLEQCIAMAPDFGPALAAHAMASVRAWFVPGLAPDRDWHALARESVARAVERAPSLAETQLAAAMFAVHELRYAEGARHVERALELAPTYADAHDYLGRLQCEAGRPEEGLRRLRVAVDLDPTLGVAWLEIARVAWLLGRRDEADEAQRIADAKFVASHAPALTQRLRFAAWSGDHDEVRRLLALTAGRNLPIFHLIQLYARAVLGEQDISSPEVLENVSNVAPNPRFRGISFQIFAEALGLRGHVDLGLVTLERVSEDILIDIVWLERCPALDSLRGEPRFQAVAELVRRRANSLWIG